jgi:hypothetical protein
MRWMLPVARIEQPERFPSRLLSNDWPGSDGALLAAN